MEITELFLLAVQSLRRNVARTFLTMLGIIIGIASVITIMSLGAGSTESIVGQISSFGANVLTVSPGRMRRGPGEQGAQVSTLVEADAAAIREVPEVEMVSRVVSKTKTLAANGVSTSSQVSGVDANYSEINSLKFTVGGFFDESDVDGLSKSVVLGDEVVTDIFGENADQFVVGETVRIDGKVFHIIGVITESSSVFIPVTTAQKTLFGQSNFLDSISLVVTDSAYVESTTTAVEQLLLERHEIKDASLADFEVRSTQSIVDTVSSITSTLTTLLSGIAAISLVVGGIGIMNIMLVTVTERTKEIGLLKALGAKNKNILSQFLIEAIVLTLSGGFVGIILGGVIAYFASSAMGITFVIKANSVLLSFGVSTLIGITFGYYPAQKAAQLQPIEALRYE